MAMRIRRKKGTVQAYAALINLSPGGATFLFLCFVSLFVRCSKEGIQTLRGAAVV